MLNAVLVLGMVLNGHLNGLNRPRGPRTQARGNRGKDESQ
jgi:hypothetical protein